MRSAILLESARPVHRDARSAFVSFTLHTLLVAGVVTLGASRVERFAPLDEGVDTLVYMPPEPVRQQPGRVIDMPLREPVEPPPSLLPPLPTDVIVAPPTVPGTLPPIPATIAAGEFSIGSTASPATGDPSGTAGGDREGPLEASAVEVPVAPRPGNPAPRYPEALRAMGVEGVVVVEYVVSAAGRVERESVRPIGGAHPLFVAAVRQALERARFAPALVGGRTVRQLVRQEFVFGLR